MPKGVIKDPFEDLSQDWKNDILSKDEGAIRKEVASIALQRQQLKAAKALDVDLKEKTEAYNKAISPYKKRVEDAENRIKYAKAFLKDPVEIEKQVSEAAFEKEKANQEAAEDQTVENCATEKKEAGEGYRTADKEYRTKIQYALYVLESKGKV